MLPPPWRDRIARREGVHAGGWSGTIGLVQLCVGGGLFGTGYLMFVGGYGSKHQMVLLENWSPGLDSGDLHFAGIFGLFAWLMHPVAWVTGYIAITGVVRIVSFLAVKEPVSEPLLALGIWITGLVSSAFRRKRRLLLLGEERPDRLVHDPEGLDCDLLVVSCRDKPAWNGRVTIEVDNRYYRLVRTEDRWEGATMVVCFFLNEVPDEEVVRGFVSYLRDPLRPG